MQLKEQLAALQAAKDALEKEKAGLEGDKAGLTQQLADTQAQLGAQGKKLEQTEVCMMSHLALGSCLSASHGPLQ
jgi:hypothetical protein